MSATVQPMRADARRNRQMILAAAAQAFAEDGIGVPVDEIARRAGVGTGTFYRHFPTKEALFEAVVLEHMSEVVAEAARRAAGLAPGEALLDFLTYLADQGATKRNLVDALAGAGIDVESRAAHFKEALEAQLSELLARAQARGEIRDDVTLGDLIGLVMGTCQYSNHGASQRRMLSVVYDGLRPSGPSAHPSDSSSEDRPAFQ